VNDADRLSLDPVMRWIVVQENYRVQKHGMVYAPKTIKIIGCTASRL
jgi:hypothetical protein